MEAILNLKTSLNMARQYLKLYLRLNSLEVTSRTIGHIFKVFVYIASILLSVESIGATSGS